MGKKVFSKTSLERRIKNAIMFVPKDTDTKSVFFDDKKVRLTVTSDRAIISTMAHTHVFELATLSGVSRPYFYTKRFIEIALENDCTAKDEKGELTRSYAKLFDILEQKEDKTEHRVAWFFDLWLSNIYAPLFSIDESEMGAFLVYEQYMHNMARNHFLLSEHKEDVTNVEFFEEVQKIEKELVEGMTEAVVIKGLSDEERVQQEIAAMKETEIENELSNTANGKSQD